MKFPKISLHFLRCSWEYFNSSGEKTELIDLEWTNEEALYRKCRECKRVEHLIRTASGQGEFYGGSWEDEKEVMIQIENGTYYGTGKRLSELRERVRRNE